MNLKQSLPPVTSLVFFESSARLKSFTLASEELFVTQAAVSRQIKHLEEHINTQLFSRLNRTIELTPAGKILYDAVSLGLNHIAGASQTISRRQKDRETLTVTASVGFSTLRLLPRLNDLKKLLPGIDIKLLADDHDIYHHMESTDLIFSIDKDNQEHKNYHSHFISKEEVFPVYNPRILPSEKKEITLDDLYNYPLIDLSFEHWGHLKEEFINWDTWFNLFAEKETTPSSSIAFNNSLLVHHAVISGQGIALGWRHVVEDQLRADQLRRIGTVEIAPARSMYLFVPKTLTEDTTTIKFVNWAKNELSYHDD